MPPQGMSKLPVSARSAWSQCPKTAAAMKETSSMTMPPTFSMLTPHSFANLARAVAISVGLSCLTSRAPLHKMPSDINASRVGPPNAAVATPVYAVTTR